MSLKTNLADNATATKRAGYREVGEVEPMFNWSFNFFVRCKIIGQLVCLFENFETTDNVGKS